MMLSGNGVEKPLWGTLKPGSDLYHCTGSPHWPHINPRNHISDCVGTRTPRRNPNPNGENVHTAHRKGFHTWELNSGPSCWEVTVLTTCPPPPQPLLSTSIRSKPWLLPVMSGANDSIPGETKCPFNIQKFSRAISSLRSISQGQTHPETLVFYVKVAGVVWYRATSFNDVLSLSLPAIVTKNTLDNSVGVAGCSQH